MPELLETLKCRRCEGPVGWVQHEGWWTPNDFCDKCWERMGGTVAGTERDDYFCPNCLLTSGHSTACEQLGVARREGRAEGFAAAKAMALAKCNEASDLAGPITRAAHDECRAEIAAMEMPEAKP
jgi:hypothetical protein